MSNIAKEWTTFICGAILGFFLGALVVGHLNKEVPKFGAVHAPVEFKVHMPDATLTPGVTVEVTREELCVRGYAGKSRNVTQSMKDKAYELYGIKHHKPGEYEIDHLISLELGGANDIKNLWPQPYHGEWNAHMKDKLENRMHKLVCEGQITMKQAQEEISQDWVEAYEKYISN